MQPSVGLPPPLQNPNKILPPAQGGVMAQMRRIFYCRINLAILLIGRHVATMLPQAAHAAPRWRHDALNRRSMRSGRGTAEVSVIARGEPAANASAIGNPIADWNSVS